MTALEDWLAKHPYLQPVAELQAVVDSALASISMSDASTPDWSAYLEDFHAGIPLLQSANAAVDLSPVESALRKLVDALGATTLAARREDPGLLRFSRSAILARYVCAVVRAFDRWRDEERWLRNYCPTCGSLPAMAQLVGKDSGHLRFLVCGACRTHWRYRRTGCPFCEHQDDRPLAVLDVEGEGGLRIDYCETCRGYLKTCNGTGNESVLLADWTSLHLDLLARDRGLTRLAASLYEL